MLRSGHPPQWAPGDRLTCSRSVHLIASGASAPPLFSLRGFRAAAPGVAAARLSRGREGDGVPNTSAPAPPRALSGAELPPLPSGRPRPAPPPPPSPPPPPQRAPPPASRPSPAAGAEPPRLGGVRGNRAAALGPTTRDRRRLIPRTAWERRAGGSAGASSSRASGGRRAAPAGPGLG